MIDNIILYNSLGWATFPCLSTGRHAKEPACTDWATREPDPLGCVAEEAEYLRAGAFGVKLNPEDLIIDLDKRHFPAGVNPWRKLRDDLALGELMPPAVITGNGAHLYFKKPANVDIKAKLRDYPGVETKSGLADGKCAYVIGAGSNHHSGAVYTFAKNADFSAIPDCPPALLEYLTRNEPILPQSSVCNGGEQEYNRYVQQLVDIEIPSMAARNGDAQRFRIACVGRDYGLKPIDTLRALSLHYNPVCVPVWSEQKLKSCVKNAYTYASGPAGKEDPVHKFEVVRDTWDSEEDGLRNWDVDTNGGMKKTLKNVVTYLYTRPELRGTVRYNQFTGDLEVTGALPWSDKRGISNTWTDADAVLLKYHLAKSSKVEFSVAIIWEALHAAGMRFAYHPVREHIQGLTWDGTSRVDKWLTNYCGVEDSSYVTTVGRKLLLGLVSRVFHPGVKFDYCIILEGAQGIGKSTVCSILGGKWYGDVIIDPHSRDTIDALRGKWVVELSEMEVTRRADAQALKAFISRTSDRARLAYARAALDFPRQCVFIGTINPDDMGYLVDHTGNRRFWPIKCGEKIDMDGLASVRDQLFAEAYQLYRAGEPLFLSGDIIQHAELEQVKRMAIDPWQDVIEAYLEDTGKDIDEISVPQIWEVVLGGQVRSLTRSDQCRIGRILSRMGWFKCRPLRGGSRQYIHRRPLMEV